MRERGAEREKEREKAREADERRRSERERERASERGNAHARARARGAERYRAHGTIFLGNLWLFSRTVRLRLATLVTHMLLCLCVYIGV